MKIRLCVSWFYVSNPNYRWTRLFFSGLAFVQVPAEKDQ